MRILITGMTPRQCAGTNRYNIMSTPEILTRCLRDVGHEVEHGAITLGEDLSRFDVALVGLFCTTALTASKRWHALDVISRVHQHDVKLGIYMDDWRLREMSNNWNFMAKSPDNIVRPFWSKLKGFEYAGEHRDALHAACVALNTRPWPPSFAFLFDWGDHSMVTKFMPTTDFTYLDPSSYVEPFTGPRASPIERKRRWVHTALPVGSPKDDKVLPWELSWPVDWFSTRKGEHNEAISEPQLLSDYYAASWGLLSVKHKVIAGAGWWRARYVHAAQTGTILLTNDDEAVNGLGDAYRLGNPLHPDTIPAVERLSSADLAQVAQAQRDALAAKVWPRDRFQQAVFDYVKKVREA